MKEHEIPSNWRSKTIQQQLIQEEGKMTILYDLSTDIRFNQGIDIGLVQGRAEGRIEGEEKATRKFAEILIRKGFSISQIGETFDLSTDQLSFLENIFSKKNQSL